MVVTTEPNELSADAEIIVAAMQGLMADVQVVEVRALQASTIDDPEICTRTGYFTHPRILANAILKIVDASGVYFCLNPIKPELLHRYHNKLCRATTTTKDEDIQERRLLLVDIDAKRPAGVSANDREHEAATSKAREVRDALVANGWPQPALADSGNGAHLLFRIEQPADDGGLVKRCLEALDARFSDAVVKIDTKVFNASRICKLYGTVARKGENTGERPHRLAQILRMPAPFEVVPENKLQALAEQAPKPVQRSRAVQHSTSPHDISIEERKRRARNYIAKIPPAIEGQDGSADTIKVAGHLIRGFDLPYDVALDVLHEFSDRCIPPWSEREIEHKLRDAEKHDGERGYLLNGHDHRLNGHAPRAEDDDEHQSGVEGRTTSRAGFPRIVTNTTVAKSDDEKAKVVPLTMAQILDRTAAQTDDWPRRVGTAIFVDDKEHGIAWLERPANLFGWLHRDVGKVMWRESVGCVTQAELFSELRRTAKQYAAIEALPHEPSIADHYYACGPIEPGDGSTLRTLLDRFNPATDIDRDLLHAAIVTPGWGGPPGARPAFLLTAEEGRGVGKTSGAEAIAEPWGGVVTFEQGEDAAQMRTRLLSPDALMKRVALLDNIKTLRFSWSTLEALITAAGIDGKRMYVGQASRPNTLTWFLTLNGASLSTDMAQRVVTIKLKRPQYAGTWKEETSAFIRENRTAILGDVIGFLRGPRNLPSKFTRWAAWERDILARLPEPNEAQTVILERQGTVDVEREEAEALEEAIGDQLVSLRYDAASDTVFIPSATLCQWYATATGRRESTTAVSRMVGQMIDESRTKQLRRNRSHAHGRGFVWQPSDQPTSIFTDLRERIAERQQQRQR